MKKIMVFALLLTALLLPTRAMAASEQVVVPEFPDVPAYQDPAKIVTEFKVQGTKGAYNVNVRGDTKIKKIIATMQIQKKSSNGSYQNYGMPWMAAAEGRLLSTSGTRDVAAGGTYRLKIVLTFETTSNTASQETVYAYA